MNQRLQEFFDVKLTTLDFKKQAIPDLGKINELADWIIYKSGWAYLPLVLPGAPYSDMLKEAFALEDLFIGHRQNKEYVNEDSPGWRSICLHGEAWDKTDFWTTYPENAGKKADEVVYKWTEITERCPITTQYFREEFPNFNYQRLRYMWLDPHGYIVPHQDRTEHRLSPINVALNNPEGCVFLMKDKGYVPFENAGNACLVDTANMHSVWNNSDTPRIHMISHGANRNTFNKIVVDSLKKLL
jgi:hypothetical protein